MRVASGAANLVPLHEEGVVLADLDVLLRDRIPEAGPPGAGLELRIRGEELRAARDAAVDTLGVVVPVLAGEGGLGAGLAGHLVLLRREQLLPLRVGLLDL